jgi:hypothetical protein
MTTETTDNVPTPELPQLPELESDRAQHQQGTLDTSEQDVMFADLAALTVDKPPTLLDRMRETSTPMRVLAAVLATTGVACVGVMLGLRPDLASADALRVGLLISALVGLIALTVAVALRGYHRKPLGPVAWVVIAAALGVPVILALFPDLWATGAAAVAPGAHRCFGFGSAVGIPSGIMVWLFQRGDRVASWRLGAAACVGGLAGFAALQMHCPSHEIGHLLIGHTSVGFVLAALAIVYAASRQRAWSAVGTKR